MTEIGDSLQFTWSDNSAVEDGYEVWVWVEQSSPDHSGIFFGEEVFAVLPVNATSWRAAKVVSVPYLSVTYYLVATKDAGRSSQMILGSW